MMNESTIIPKKHQILFSKLLLLALLSVSLNGFSQKEDSLSYITNDDEYNIVMAAFRGDYNIVNDLLEKGISPNILIEESLSPLANAARGGHIRIARLLLSKGADINIRPRNGNTPLIAAVKSRQYNMVDFLIEKGANINLSNDFGRTPIIYATVNNDSLMFAKLRAQKADVQYRDTTGCTAFMAAVALKNIQMVLMLIEAGANVNAADNYGITPIMLAANNLDYNITNILLAYGANINAVSKHKQTALTIAIERGDEQFLLYLIELGADVNQKLNYAETPLTIAKYLQSDAFLIDDLKDKGAKQNIWPDFRTIFVGPSISFNNNDFMPGLVLGLKDYKYDIDFYAGFSIRPFASRVLTKINNEDFQFWERRYSFYAGVDKRFLLKVNKYKHRHGLLLDMRVNQSYTSYRGIDYTPESKLIFSPGLGYYYSSRLLTAGVGYYYCDFGLEGVAPHKIEVSVKFHIGKAFRFNHESYKIWE